MSTEEKEFSVGVIMLNTNFPRILGDIGNAKTFPFPVHYERVESAAVSAIITRDGVSESVKNDILKSIKNLENQKVDLITTSCGFLGEMQDELKSLTHVPILTSSLLTIPFARTFLNKKEDKIGVLTFDAKQLNNRHFGGHYSDDIIISDISKDSVLYKAIKNDHLDFDVDTAKNEVVESSLNLIKNNKDIKIIVLECTNLSPYIDAIKKATNLPVFDVIQAINWFKNSHQ
ncbi:hypothetical protein DN730_06250 [Marinomonas piezotolerans]|uniref:Aspartate/glutamate racemase family protein n=1 Tax=Marinomonas piezotolerans TaxID=2213058 RepID=A0A370UBN1_9GAMM|nr:aspartate/glutamate racemase family protein [Marinomonas piezotolerans]RDL45207.1 hypothetical protein DN730_06250 [Marinomonas piezotolerans]